MNLYLTISKPDFQKNIDWLTWNFWSSRRVLFWRMWFAVGYHRGTKFHSTTTQSLHLVSSISKLSILSSGFSNEYLRVSLNIVFTCNSVCMCCLLKLTHISSKCSANLIPISERTFLIPYISNVNRHIKKRNALIILYIKRRR